MKIDARGRVTIPKRLRDRHGLTPGTDADFVVQDGVLLLKKGPPESLASLYRRKTFDRGADGLTKLLRLD